MRKIILPLCNWPVDERPTSDVHHWYRLAMRDAKGQGRARHTEERTAGRLRQLEVKR